MASKEYERVRDWQRRNPEKYKAQRQRVRDRKRDDEEYKRKQRERAKRRRLQLRDEALDAYGGCCVCCGQDQRDFLTFHHKDGLTEAEKGPNGRKYWSTRLYLWLKRQGWPDIVEILCGDCHQATNIHGHCPHH